MRAAQRRILDAAVGLLRPGGRLMYATCSLLTAENEAVALAFEAAHPALSRLNLAWPDASDAGLRPAAISGAHGFIRIWPHMDQCDGYFAAAWRMTNAANVV